MNGLRIGRTLFDLLGAGVAIYAGAEPALQQFRVSQRDPWPLLAMWLTTVVIWSAIVALRVVAAGTRGRGWSIPVRSGHLMQLAVLTSCTTLALSRLAPFPCVQASGVLPQFAWLYVAIHVAVVIALAWRARPDTVLSDDVLLLVLLTALNGRLFFSDFAILAVLLISAGLAFLDREGARDGDEPARLPLGPAPRALCFVAFVAALATWFSSEPERSYNALVPLLVYCGLMLLAGAYVRDARRAGNVAVLLLLGMLVTAAFTLTIALVAWPHATPRALFNTRFQVLNAHPNLVAPHYAAALVIAAGLLLAGTRSRAARVVLVLSILFLGGALLQAASKAAMGAAVVGVAIVLVARSQRPLAVLRSLARPRILAACAVGLALLVAAFQGLAPRGMRERFSASGMVMSAQYRIDMWTAAAHVIADRPWLGVGPENYRRSAAFIDNSQAQGEKRAPHPHNLLLAVAQATGLPGAAAFLLALIAFASLVLRVRRDHSDPRARQLAVMFGAAIATLLTCCIVDVGPALGSFLPGMLLVAVGAVTGLARGIEGPKTARPAGRGTRPRRRAWMHGAAAGLAFTALAVLTLRPALAQHEVFQARAFLRAGDAVRARESFDRALELEPWNLSTRLALVDVEQRMPTRTAEDRDRNLDRAEARLRRILEIWPDDPGPYLTLSTIQQARGRPLDAMRSIETAIDRSPAMVTSGVYHAQLGALFAALGDRDGAFEEFKRALTIDISLVNQIPWSKRRRADGFDDQIMVIRTSAPDGTEETQEFRAEDVFKAILAEQEAELAAGQEPSVPSWLKIYHLYYNAHDYDDAEAVLGTIERLPNFRRSSLAAELGNIRQRQGKLAEALEIYEEGLAVREDLRLRIAAAGAHRALGDLRMARNHLQACLRLKEDFLATADVHAEVFRSLGEVCAETGAVADAVEFDRDALFFIPDPGQRLELLSRIARLERERQRPAQALAACEEGAAILARAGMDLVQQGIENPPRTLALETARVRSALVAEAAPGDLKEIDDAVRMLARPEHFNTYNPGHALFAAYLLFTLGDVDSAQAALERSRDVAPLNRLARIAGIDILIAARRVEHVDELLKELREVGVITGYDAVAQARLLREFEAETRAGTITPDLQRDVGDFFLLTGDFPRAKEFYEHAVGQRADDPELLARMGRVLFLMDRRQEAEIWFRHAADLDPDSGVFRLMARGVLP